MGQARRTMRRRSLLGGMLVLVLGLMVWQAISIASASPAPAASRPSAASAAAPAAASAAGQDCHAVKRGGTLQYGVDQDVISFDAANTQDNGSLWADMNIYDQLVRLNPDGTKVVPDLAQSWTVKNGGRVYVFHLRHDARFYDGTPVTAADVAFTYDRVRSPKSVVNWTLEAVKSDRAIGKYTFQVTLKQPWAPFLNDISLWGASIMSKKAVLKWGNQIGKHPVGSGPFYVAKWLPGQYVLLKRNPYYWEKDACGNQYPYLDAVQLDYVPNDNTRIVKLESGSLDAAVDVPYNLLQAVDKQPNVTAKTTPQLGIMSIALNQTFAPFTDQKVVQAMNYAVDRNAIVKAVFFGKAAAATSPIDPGVYFHTSKYGYPFDLSKAKTLMKQSKYPNGFTVTLLTISGDSIGDAVGVIMQDELKQIGINLKLQALDSTTQFERQQKRQFQMAWGYGTSDNLDPNSNMLYCCVSTGGAQSGYTGWKDPQADALYGKTQTAINVATRGKLFDQWQKIVMAKAPFMWLINPTNRFAYRDNVHDFFLQNTAHWPLWVAWKS
jgi:peptide/nickel transport system substrate-binding protein